jgi:hypothetical protein
MTKTLRLSIFVKLALEVSPSIMTKSLKTLCLSVFAAKPKTNKKTLIIQFCDTSSKITNFEIRSSKMKLL